MRLEEEFARFIGPEGIIVRTSVPADSEKIPNLPRTEGLSPKQAVEWCLETASTLKNKHSFPIAFICHRFIPARASAWTRASPDAASVEIHSLWGLPDALQFCPYDIWDVHLQTGGATNYPEYKSYMLVAEANGSWNYVRVKNELARHNSITVAEARELASRSAQIAKRLGQGCHIMWFVGCADPLGNTFSLPWYWTKSHATEPNHDRGIHDVVVVSDRHSLQTFANLQGIEKRRALKLMPTDLDVMRDTAFISEVGDCANAAGVPIILAGSSLAHAYYLLRAKDCTVVTPSAKQHSRVRQKTRLGKLVRDNIPEKPLMHMAPVRSTCCR